MSTYVSVIDHVEEAGRAAAPAAEPSATIFLNARNPLIFNAYVP